MTSIRRTRKTGFTLVEILIVVIILGILAAIVIPQFTNASTDARKSSLTSQLQTLRSQVELYKLQHNDHYPTTGGVAADGSDGTWDWSLLTGKTDITGAAGGNIGPYLQAIPVNPLNTFKALALAPAAATGWVFRGSDGKVFATGMDPTLYFNEATGLDQAAAP